MSGESPDESPRARFLRALAVPRNARIGLVAGLVVAAAAYVAFVLLPGAPPGQALLYLVLAGVVVVATGVIVTVALTVRRVALLTMSPPRWIRRAGTAALVGGAALVALAAGSPLAASHPLGIALYGWLPVVVLGPVAGAWGVHAAHRHRDGYLGLVGATLSAIGLLVVGWLAASDPGAFLGRPVRGAPRTVLVALFLALAGTWLVGAATLRAGRLPKASALAAMAALPGALAGLTALAYADLGAYAVVAPTLSLGAAWVAVGSALRAGRGVPPADAFRTAVSPGGPTGSDDSSDPGGG